MPERRSQDVRTSVGRGSTNAAWCLSTSRLDAGAARLALSTKARDFIDDWMSRNEAGQSQFSDL